MIDKLLYKTNLDYDIFLAARYLYYVENCNIISDHDYDVLEKMYEKKFGSLPVGSDDKEDYSPSTRALALYFQLSNRTIA